MHSHYLGSPAGVINTVIQAAAKLDRREGIRHSNATLPPSGSKLSFSANAGNCTSVLETKALLVKDAGEGWWWMEG